MKALLISGVVIGTFIGPALAFQQGSPGRDAVDVGGNLRQIEKNKQNEQKQFDDYDRTRGNRPQQNQGGTTNAR